MLGWTVVLPKILGSGRKFHQRLWKKYFITSEWIFRCLIIHQDIILLNWDWTSLPNWQNEEKEKQVQDLSRTMMHVQAPTEPLAWKMV